MMKYNQPFLKSLNKLRLFKNEVIQEVVLSRMSKISSVSKFLSCNEKKIELKKG